MAFAEESGYIRAFLRGMEGNGGGGGATSGCAYGYVCEAPRCRVWKRGTSMRSNEILIYGKIMYQKDVYRRQTTRHTSVFTRHTAGVPCWLAMCRSVVLQCAALWCSVLQCVAVCCSVLQCVAVRCSVAQMQLRCSVLQCGVNAVCCLQGGPCLV